MIEELLLQYGPLGLWLVYMIVKERTYMLKMRDAMTENTASTTALILFLKGGRK